MLRESRQCAPGRVVQAEGEPYRACRENTLFGLSSVNACRSLRPQRYGVALA